MTKLILLFALFTGVNESKQGNYESGLALLKYSQNVVSRENYNDYWFYRAVCHHQLIEQREAVKAIEYLRNSFEPIPVRYQSLSYLIELDLRNWNEKGLDDIERRMNNVRRRLEQARGGEETQRQQKEIVRRLDEMIKKEEDKNKPKGSESQAKSGEREAQIPGSAPSSPANESVIMGGSGKGVLDEKKMKQYAEQWGGLPPLKRAKIIEDVTSDLPTRYKPQIEEYFKALNKIHGFTDTKFK